MYRHIKLACFSHCLLNDQCAILVYDGNKCSKRSIENIQRDKKISEDSRKKKCAKKIAI